MTTLRGHVTSNRPPGLILLVARSRPENPEAKSALSGFRGRYLRCVGTPEIPATRAYWTTDELTERFGWHQDKIYALASIGGLPHNRWGRDYRFPIAEVLEWEKRTRIVNDGTTSPRPQAKRPRKTAGKKQAFVPQPGKLSLKELKEAA